MTSSPLTLDLGSAGSNVATLARVRQDCRVAVYRDVAALASSWRDLETRAGGTHFQSYAWCDAWAEANAAAGCRVTPCIVTVWQNDRLVLLWPLVRRRFGPFRVLQTFGEPASQYSDALVERGPEQERWLALAWTHIRALRGIAAIVLKCVRSDAAIAALAGERNDAFLTRQMVAPYAGLQEDGSLGTVQRRSSRTRNAIKRHLRNLGEHGPVSFTRLTDPEARVAAIDQALRLKHDWLSRTAQVSAGYDHPANRAFLRNLAAQPDFLVLRLGVGAETAAIEAGSVRDGYYWSLVQSYDVRYATHGPGRLLFQYILANPSEFGVTRLDFLAPAYPHKQEWADGEVAVRDYVIPMRPTGWLVLIYRRDLRPRLKVWRERLSRPSHLFRWGWWRHGDKS